MQLTGFPGDQKRATFFLDEIQVVAGWEVFVRRILDSEKIDLFLSGSSARLLSREVAFTGKAPAIIETPIGTTIVEARDWLLL